MCTSKEILFLSFLVVIVTTQEITITLVHIFNQKSPLLFQKSPLIYFKNHPYNMFIKKKKKRKENTRNYNYNYKILSN